MMCDHGSDATARCSRLEVALDVGRYAMSVSAPRPRASVRLSRPSSAPRARPPPPLLRRGAPLPARRQQSDRLLERQRSRARAFGHRRVRRAVGDVRPVAPGEQLRSSRRLDAVELAQHLLLRRTAGDATASAARSNSRAASSVMSNTSSSDSSERNSSPCFTYGPKRPKLAMMASPSSGCMPTTRGSDSSFERLVERDGRLGHRCLAATRASASPPCLPFSGVSPSCTYGAEAAVHHVDGQARLRIGAERARPFGLGAHQLERLLDRADRPARRPPAATRCGRVRPRRPARTGRSARCERGSARRVVGIVAEVDHRVVRVLGAVLDGGQQPAMLLVAVVELLEERRATRARRWRSRRGPPPSRR